MVTFFSTFFKPDGTKYIGYSNSIYIVPENSTVNSNMPLSEDNTRQGVYYRENVPLGNYKIYIDANKSGSALESDLVKLPNGNPYIITSGSFADTPPTANRVIISDNNQKAVSSTITSTELGYLSGVTSAIQTQINNNAIVNGTANQIYGMNAGATGREWKTLSGTTNQVTATHGTGTLTLSLPQDIHTGASPTFTNVNASTAYKIGNTDVLTALPTASRALVSDANQKIVSSSVTSTELGYVSGVTSAIQTQINNISAPIIKIKTANETVTSSTTLQDDDHLNSISLVANSNYKLEMDLMINSNATGSFYAQLAGTQAFALSINLLQNTSSSTTFDYSTSLTASLTSHIIIDEMKTYTGIGGAKIEGLLTVGANATTIKLQWAQRASNVSGTILMKGSSIQLTKIP